MKKIMIFFSTGVLVGALCTVFTACNNDVSEQPDKERPIAMAQLADEVYYVAGYHANAGYVVDEETGTVEVGQYLFISENLQDTVCVNNRTRLSQYAMT
jgi:hypothetical protein